MFKPDSTWGCVDQTRRWQDHHRLLYVTTDLAAALSWQQMDRRRLQLQPRCNFACFAGSLVGLLLSHLWRVAICDNKVTCGLDEYINYELNILPFETVEFHCDGFACLCTAVCLSVSGITQKVVNKFLVTIRVRIKEYFKRNLYYFGIDARVIIRNSRPTP